MLNYLSFMFFKANKSCTLNTLSAIILSPMSQELTKFALSTIVWTIICRRNIIYKSTCRWTNQKFNCNPNLVCGKSGSLGTRCFGFPNWTLGSVYGNSIFRNLDLKSIRAKYLTNSWLGHILTSLHYFDIINHSTVC